MLHEVQCENEMALLNEDEKSLYQKQQKEYSEREIFVNRLEQLDRVIMPKVKLKRFTVKDIKPVEVNAVSISEKKSISQPEQLKRIFSAVEMKQCIPVHIDKYRLTPLSRVCVERGKCINWEQKSYDIHKTVIPKVNRPQISCELESNTEITAFPTVYFDSPKKIEVALPSPDTVPVANSKVVAEVKKIKFSCEPYQITTTKVLKKQAPEIGYELPESMVKVPSYKSMDAPQIKIPAYEKSELKISAPCGKVTEVPEVKSSVYKTKVEKVRKVFYQCPKVECEESSHTTILPDILVVLPDARGINPVFVGYNESNNQIIHTEKPNIQVPVDSGMKCSDTLNKILIRLRG